MKHYLLTLTFLTSGFASFSQSYQTVYPEREPLFNNVVWSEQSRQLRPGSISSIQVDSFKTELGHTVYFYPQTLREEAPCIDWLYTKAPYWIGEKSIVKADGWNIFFNKHGDSIRIKTNAGLNDTWHLTDLANGNYFEATVTEKKEMTYLSMTDSFKVISIQLKDNTGNPLSHNFNNEQIILSRSNGLIRAYDFYMFPEDTSRFQLIGITNPDLGVQNITAKEIFDFNVGDVFQIEEGSIDPTFLSSFKKQQRIILGKTVSADKNTITYSVETSTHHRYTDYINSSNSFISNKKDTIDEVITLSAWSSLSDPPLKLITSDNVLSFSSMLHYKAFNNRTYKTTAGQPYIKNEDGCFSPIVFIGMAGYQYIEGLGEYYDTGVDWLSSNYRRLIYYKKGSEEWGTPIDFDILLSSVLRSETVISSSVSPNPFSRSATVEINNWNKQTYHLQVIDLYGKVVMKLSTDENRFEINNDGNLSGAYTYKLFNDNNQVGTGKLMIY